LTKYAGIIPLFLNLRHQTEVYSSVLFTTQLLHGNVPSYSFKIHEHNWSVAKIWTRI